MKSIKIMLLAVFIIALLAITLSGCAGIGDSDFKIRVTGSDGLIFSGSYLITTSAGNSVSKSVDGIVPAEYVVRGNIVSVAFQKRYEGGILKVEILKNDKVVSQSETSAAYGVVSVATQ